MKKLQNRLATIVGYIIGFSCIAVMVIVPITIVLECIKIIGRIFGG